MFRTLNRKSCSKNTNAHRHSFIRCCSEKYFRFEWKRSEFWRHFTKPHPSSNAPFQHDTWSNTIKNTFYNEFNLQLHFSIFVAERAYDPYWEYVTETGIAYTELILTFGRLTRASKAHPIQHSHDTHDLNWALCYFSFEKPALSSPSERCSYFLFHEYTDSVLIRESNRVLACTQSIIQRCFSEEEQVLR